MIQVVNNTTATRHKDVSIYTDSGISSTIVQSLDVSRFYRSQRIERKSNNISYVDIDNKVSLDIESQFLAFAKAKRNRTNK